MNRAPFRIAWCLCFASWLAAAQLIGTENADERFLEGLRQRRLFALAESFCQQQLARPNLADSSRGKFATELIRSPTLPY